MFLILNNTSRYEFLFITGFNGSNIISKKLLKLMIIKEIFKQWKMAHISLSSKKWPKLIIFFLRKMYVDRFYK